MELSLLSDRVHVNLNMNPEYEPIPFEMLKSYETAPQILVSVNVNSAVCHRLNLINVDINVDKI